MSMRPPLTTSSVAISSATTSGWCSGTTITASATHTRDPPPAPPHPRRLPGDIGGELHGTGQVAVSGEVMLGQPHTAKAERLRGLRQLDAARVDLLRGARGGRLAEEEGADFHRYGGSDEASEVKRVCPGGRG